MDEKGKATKHVAIMRTINNRGMILAGMNKLRAALKWTYSYILKISQRLKRLNSSR